MTQIAIQAQVDAINKVTEKAAKSKESATKFLQDAGIILKEVPPKTAIKSKSKK
jgi:hypothetical protein